MFSDRFLEASFNNRFLSDCNLIKEGNGKYNKDGILIIDENLINTLHGKRYRYFLDTQDALLLIKYLSHRDNPQPHMFSEFLNDLFQGSEIKKRITEITNRLSINDYRFHPENAEKIEMYLLGVQDALRSVE